MAEGKILIRTVVDAAGGIRVLAELAGETKKAASEVRSQERETQRLLERLEPARVATQRYAREQALLQKALADGSVTSDRYRAAVKELETQHERAQRGSSTFSDSLKGLAGAFAGVMSASAVVDFIGGSVKAFIAAEESNVRFQAVLKATGGVAGVTAQSITDYATRMQNLTGTSDEVIMDGAAILATFKSIKSDAFDRTMTAAMDLSAVFGQDLKSSVTQLGKALEDPERGLTALRRVGVSFTKDQQEVIKSLVDTNRLAEAQAMILEAVETQVGGTATALGQTLGGQLKVLNENWGDMQESIGGALAEWLNLKEVAQWWTQYIRANTSQGASVTTGLTHEQLRANIAQYRELAASQKEMAARHKENKELLMQYTAEQLKWNEKAAEAERALRALGAETKALGDETGAVTVLTEEQEKSLTNLLDRLDPVAKSTRQYRENVELLNRALASGEITGAQYRSAIAALDAEMEKSTIMSGQKILDGLVKGLKTSDYQSLTQGLQELLDKSVKGITNYAPAIKLDTPAQKSETEKWAESLKTAVEDSLSRAFKGGLESLMTGGDFKDAWEGLWKDLAAIAASNLAATIKQGLFGGSGPMGENIAGLFGGGGVAMTTGQKVQVGAGLLGAGLMYYGAQKQDKTASTVGGAVSGAVSGFSMGGPWGAVIGALIGGYMGYQSIKDNKSNYNLLYVPALRYTSAGVQHMGDVEQREIGRQISDTAMGYQMAIRSVGRDLGLGALTFGHGGEMIRMNGSSGNTADVLQAFMRGELPRGLFGMVSGQISEGLGGMGVSGERTNALMRAFESGSFDAALQQLQQFVQALTGLVDASGLLGMTADEMRAEVSMSLREGFLRGFEETMEDVGDLLDGFDELFGPEQVANAQQLAALAETQYNAGIRYFAQLEQMRQSIGLSFDDMFLGWQEQRAQEGGYANQFYEQQITGLLGQLGGASSAEQVQRLVGQIQKFGGSLWSMGDMWTGPEGEGRLRVEEWMREAQRIADEKLLAWEEEVAAKNAELKEQIDKMADALRGNVVSSEMASEGADRFTEAVSEGADGVSLFTRRIQEANDALSDWTTALRRQGAGWN